MLKLESFCVYSCICSFNTRRLLCYTDSQLNKHDPPLLRNRYHSPCSGFKTEAQCVWWLARGLLLIGLMGLQMSQGLFKLESTLIRIKCCVFQRKASIIFFQEKKKYNPCFEYIKRKKKYMYQGTGN